MNTRSYKVIFVLLSLSVASIIVLQAYWLQNFYIQKTEEFNRNVYEVLAEVGTKLRDRKNLESLKMTYFIQNGDTVAKTPSRNKIVIQSEDDVRVTNTSGGHFKVRTVQQTKRVSPAKNPIVISSSSGGNTSIELRGNHSRVIAENNSSLKTEPKKESTYEISSDLSLAELDADLSLASPDSLLQQLASIDSMIAPLNKKVNKQVKELMNKVMTEVIVLDTETRNKDTVNAIIKRSLDNRGLFLPFEFSSRKILKTGKTDTLTQSDSFNEAAAYYKSDLTGSNVIPTHEWLYLQFPNKKDYVMAGMRSSIILSILFSLLLVSIFYYVIRLIRRQKILSEIKNDFVNNMTHELKTPIATISLAVDAMNNPQIRNNEERFKEYSRILKEENYKLNKHVEDVLQISMLDKGEVHFKQEIIDLPHLIQTVLKSFKLRFLEQKAEVSFDWNGEQIPIKGDPKHLSTVFSNLIDNALKYGKGKSLIDIRLSRKQGIIETRFRDNGIGIAEEHHKKIFGKFYRVQGGNLHDVKGFGLGLSYVKSVVEAHGGTVSLKSDPGEGSEFILQFPETLTT
ncbi:MAG: HAMP domain-containing histidine kinase [Bacteroidia bacterium]|nr:HAMP domain-containing histidine kinase [Bacteroidia bacterium]